MKSIGTHKNGAFSRSILLCGNNCPTIVALSWRYYGGRNNRTKTGAPGGGKPRAPRAGRRTQAWSTAPEGQRKRRTLSLRSGQVPGNALQRAMDETARQRRGDQKISSRK